MEEIAGSMESQPSGQQDLWQAGGLGDPLEGVVSPVWT